MKKLVNGIQQVFKGDQLVAESKKVLRVLKQKNKNMNTKQKISSQNETTSRITLLKSQVKTEITNFDSASATVKPFRILRVLFANEITQYHIHEALL